MMGDSTAGGFVDARGNSYREPFLTSQRAPAVCTREVARLSDDIVRGALALSGATVEHKAVVRQSPDRCIVQLGPVALTFAWLRNNQESVAMGELLVIIWRGAVAPSREYAPERPSSRPSPIPAMPLWEEVLTPVGDSEATWGWQPRQSEAARYSSTELAASCVERLRLAYLESGAPPLPVGEV